MTRAMIDILMPIHDNLSWVKLAVQAIGEFTKNPYRLVLIDNASEEPETREWLAKLGSAREVVVIYRSENDSFSESINHGLTWTKANDPATYVCFLNSDAIVTPNWDVIMTTEAGRPEIGMTGASDGTFRPGQDVGVQFLIFFAVMARREVVDKVGLLDHESCPGWGGGEDLDYSWRIADYEVPRRQAYPQGCAPPPDEKFKPYRLMASAATIFHGVSQTYGKRRLVGEAKADLEAANRERLKKKHGIERFNRGLKVRPRIMFGRLSRTEMLIDSYVDCCTNMFIGTRGQVDWLFGRVTRTLVDMGRNAICERALARDADYVLFIDDDMTFEGDLALRLIEHDKDVVSAWAYQRGEPHDPVAYEWCKEANGYVSMRNAANTGLRRVDAVGFGAVLIKTKVLKGMKKPWFKFEKFGEDIGFCHEARAQGFEVYCDTNLEIGHLGGRIEVNNSFVAAYREYKGDVISGPT